MSRTIALALLLAGCVALEERPSTRALICNGPTQDIRDDDPGLRLIEDRDPGNPKGLKVALSIERTNNCPPGDSE